MYPSSAMNAVPNSRHGNVVFAGKGARNPVRNPSCCANPSDSADLLGGQFGIVMLFTTHLSAFLGGVAVVVGASAEEKVRGILAKWVVATMKSAKAGRNRTVGDGPGDAMCDCYTVFTTPTKRAVVVDFARRPRPAFVCSSDVHLVPETENLLRREGWDATVWGSHARLLTRRSWSGRFAVHSVSRPLLRHDTRKAA